jgi:exonuclease VII small subunit
MSGEESLQRAEALLERLEKTRQELESTQDPDRAIEILSELAEIAKDVEAELNRAKQEAG